MLITAINILRNNYYISYERELHEYAQCIIYLLICCVRIA